MGLAAASQQEIFYLMKHAELRHILVVDDSKINTSLLANVLSEYRVTTAFNGQTALDRARSDRPDLILLDIQMPGMDGFEVCEQLKGSPETSDIPVIFITGMTEPENVTRGFTLGAVDYIAKPFEFSEVRARVHTHLSLKEAREALLRQNTLLEETIRQQQIDISLTRNILQVINAQPPRHTAIANGHCLFTIATAMPCGAEGGDHYLIKNLPATANRPPRTIIALKDQSGHAVNCVLRSVVTDLFHNALVAHHPEASLEELVSGLNRTICQSKLFAQDDFCTAFFVEIDHLSLVMRFISAGHPPLMLVRGNDIVCLPAARQRGANLPLSVVEDLPFAAGSFELSAGDRLIIFTDGLNAIPLNVGRDALTQEELNGLLRQVASSQARLPVTGLLAGLLDAAASVGQQTPVSFTRNIFDDDISLIGIELETEDGWEEEELLPERFPSIDSMIEQICERLRQNARQAGHELASPQFEMALAEAVLNSWRHGHNEAKHLPILVRWRTGNDFMVEITDRGTGFDPGSIPPPTGQNTITRSSGRGIFIIRRYTSATCWKNAGKTLCMAFANNKTAHLEEHRNIFPTFFDLWAKRVIQ